MQSPIRATRQIMTGLLTVLLIVAHALAAQPQPASRLLSELSGWSRNTWSGSGTLERTGEGAAAEFHIASSSGGDLGWTITVPVTPRTLYRLSGQIRTESVTPDSGLGALFNIHTMDAARTRPVTGTSDWTDVDLVFAVGDRSEVMINCLFGGWGQSRGSAWYRNIRLDEFNPANAQPSVTIEGAQERPMMSDLIYGQFIEHMGRCIYGGIWSEMLEDRKFYYPITANYQPYRHFTDSDFPAIGASPWEIVGDASGVTMVEADAFVGDHSPRLGDGLAIRQHRLALQAGREYVGYVWAKAASGDPVVTVSIGRQPDDIVLKARAGSDYTRSPFTFKAAQDDDNATLTIAVSGGAAFIGTVSLMPADNVAGLRADTLSLLKQLKSPIYRWPGGNFVSGYDWRDGIGDRDRRPPRTNPAWTGVEPNDFGMNEFIHLCRILNAEPLITVNMGFEGAFSAEAEMEYANGTSGYWADRRAANGDREPFDVKYWAIGNEMWGDWQLGFMSAEDYQKKNNWVVDRLRKRFGGFVALASGNAGSWSQGLLEHCADHMDLIAEHFYVQHRDDVAEHVRLVPEAIRAKAAFHRRVQSTLPNLQGRTIPIAMTEWNYWYGPYLYGELGTRYYLRDALGIAAGIHEYARSSDAIGAAFYAQTVNVIGAIKTTRTDAFLAATALPLIMYREHFGTIPLAIDAGYSAMLGVDVMAALTDDRQYLTVGIVNANAEPTTVRLSLKDLKVAANARVWRFSGDDPDSFNDADHMRIAIEELPEAPFGEVVTVPGYSASIYRVRVQR